jgi:hypothetical protein
MFPQRRPPHLEVQGHRHQRSNGKRTFNLVTRREGTNGTVEVKDVYLAWKGTDTVTFDFPADQLPGRYFITLQGADNEAPSLESVPTKAIDITRANCTPQTVP